MRIISRSTAALFKTMLTREQSLALVLRRLAALGRELGKPTLEKADEQTRLFGEA